MSVLWAGGEDIDFTVNALDISTNVLHRRTDYARCAIDLRTGTLAQTTLAQAFPGGAVTSCWLSFQSYGSSYPNLNQRFAGLGQRSTSTRGIFVGLKGSTRLALYSFDGTTQTELAAGTAGKLVVSTIQKVDMQIADYGGDCTINVYVNGEADPDITYDLGATTVSGVTGFDVVMLVCTLSGVNTHTISEIIVADEDTRTFSLKTLAPNAAGDASDWDNAYTEIDEVSLNDADTVYTNTANEEFMANLTDLPTGNFSIVGVVESVRACKTDDALIGGLQIGIKSLGSTNYGSTISLTTGWDTYLRVFQTNPISSAVFTEAEIDALQLALKSIEQSSASASASSTPSASISKSASAS